MERGRKQDGSFDLSVADAMTGEEGVCVCVRVCVCVCIVTAETLRNVILKSSWELDVREIRYAGCRAECLNYSRKSLIFLINLPISCDRGAPDEYYQPFCCTSLSKQAPFVPLSNSIKSPGALIQPLERGSPVFLLGDITEDIFSSDLRRFLRVDGADSRTLTSPRGGAATAVHSLESARACQKATFVCACGNSTSAHMECVCQHVANA